VRLAYLVTAFDQPEHLGRLAKALTWEEARIYIHVDAKVDIQPFLASVGDAPRTRFLRDRVRVEWMGFSQVTSTLRLLREAVRDGFDHCVLITGSDYPIKTNEQITSFYGSTREQFISFWRIADRPSWWHKLEYFYPVDLISIHGWAKNREPSYLRRLFWGRYFKHRDVLPKRRPPRGLVPYGGSDWWSISYDCARFVLRFLDQNPWFSDFFRWTLCPNDMFFQTLIMNSEWAQTAHRYDDYEEWSRSTSLEAKQAGDQMLPESTFNLRHIDWSGEKTGDRELPAVLDLRDWEALRASPCLFARKFDVQRSRELLDRIDGELRGATRCSGRAIA